MPWKVVEENGRYCVYKENEKLKCYDSKKEAEDYKAALYASEKAWIENLSDVDIRQLEQGVAGYQPLGFTPEKGCANCHWFVSPNSCLLVQGDVSPIGVCDLWREQPQAVYASKSWFDRLVERLKDIFAPASPRAPVQSSFLFIKSNDRWRFFATVSNCFKDRHDEIISTRAHQEYVAWVTESKQYPELWLWHSGKDSKWGQVDWVDFADGFLVMSGLVDAEKEWLVPALQHEELGTSHGFFGLKTVNNIIERYRTFEVSALPRWAAANIWTDFNLEEADMAFTQEKRDWLREKAGVSEEIVASWEASIEGLSQKLKDAGLEWKETETVPEDVVAMMKTVTDFSEHFQASIAEMRTELKATTDALTAAHASLKEALDALAAAQQEQSKTFEERVATVFTAKIAELPQGYEASKSEDTEAKDLPSNDIAWFGEMLAGTLDR